MIPEAEEQRKLVAQSQVDVVGGKAHNLLILADLSKEIGFEVPAFRVIPVGANYDDAQLLDLFESLSKPLAVRSSSPYEDSKGPSFAGMFESFLGISDFQSFREAVENVKASAKGDRASNYARQHGITIDERMAVIVQEMADPLYSGVCYSTASSEDPRIIVEFVKGLSNNLMSGDQQGSIANFDQDFRLTMEHGSEMPNLGRVARVARNLEAALGQRLDVEFAVSRDGEISIVQARPIADPEWKHAELPEINSLDAILGADIVRGAGTFSGVVFVFRSPTRMQRYAASRNRQPTIEIDKQWQRLIEFNRDHPEGFCLVTDNLEAHKILIQDDGLSHLKALVTVDYASRFSHPAKIVSETGAFYLGVVGRNDLLEIIETGDTLTVASNHLRGVIYSLTKPETKQQVIDLTETPIIEYRKAMAMPNPSYEDVDDCVFLDRLGESGVIFWDYNEENGVPTDVFYCLIDKDGNVLAKGEYHASQAMRRFLDFPSLLNSLLLEC